MGSLEGNEGYGRADYFLVGKDFPSYIECQEKVDEAYRDLKVSNGSLNLAVQILFTLWLTTWLELWAEMDQNVNLEHSRLL